MYLTFGNSILAGSFDQFTIGQAITAFISVNLFAILVHVIIMIRTGGEYKQRIVTLEREMGEVKGDTKDLLDRVSYIEGNTNGREKRK